MFCRGLLPYLFIAFLYEIDLNLLKIPGNGGKTAIPTGLATTGSSFQLMMRLNCSGDVLIVIVRIAQAA